MSQALLTVPTSLRSVVLNRFAPENNRLKLLTNLCSNLIKYNVQLYYPIQCNSKLLLNVECHVAFAGAKRPGRGAEAGTVDIDLRPLKNSNCLRHRPIIASKCSSISKSCIN